MNCYPSLSWLRKALLKLGISSGGGVLANERNIGLTIFSFTVTNAITILTGTAYNLFNSTDGILSTNGTLTISGDSWNRMSAFENEYIKPDPYTHSDESFRAIETLVFARIPAIVGSGSRPYRFEIRRRTAGSPTVPVAIPQRDIVVVADFRADSFALKRMPTRSAGATDNYNVYGWALYIVNDSGQSLTIPAAQNVRVEVLDAYAKTAVFSTLTSPNV